MSAEQTTIAVGYVRVASGSQQERESSVYLQRQAILRYAKINGIPIPRFFSDHACVADIAERQGLIPKVDTVELLAKVLGVPPSWLAFGVSTHPVATIRNEGVPSR